MLIRHAQPSDGDACAAIYGPFVSDTLITLEEQRPGPGELSRRIAQISEAYPWLVAELSGTVVAFAYASQHRQRASYRWAADVSVYVDPTHQRRGVGRALYLELFEVLRHQQLRTVCAGITLPNPGSQALHESLGFTLVGVYRRIGFKLETWVDVGWWQLQLGPAPAGPPAEPRPPLRTRG